MIIIFSKELDTQKKLITLCINKGLSVVSQNEDTVYLKGKKNYYAWPLGRIYPFTCIDKGKILSRENEIVFDFSVLPFSTACFLVNVIGGVLFLFNYDGKMGYFIVPLILIVLHFATIWAIKGWIIGEIGKTDPSLLTLIKSD